MFGGACFALETFERFRLPHGLVWQKLNGDVASELHVLRLEYDAHAAAAEPFEDAIVRDRVTDHWSGHACYTREGGRDKIRER